MASFQALVDEFFESAPSTIKKYTQYIFDFLLAASGSEDEEDHDEMVSQLAIDMEEMELNPVRMQWASTHFSIVKKIALQHDKWMEKEVQQAEKTINCQETSLAHQAAAKSSTVPGKQNAVDSLHSFQGETCTSDRSGQQNPTRDDGSALQASSHAKQT